MVASAGRQQPYRPTLWNRWTTSVGNAFQRAGPPQAFGCLVDADPHDFDPRPVSVRVFKACMGVGRTILVRFVRESDTILFLGLRGPHGRELDIERVRILFRRLASNLNMKAMV